MLYAFLAYYSLSLASMLLYKPGMIEQANFYNIFTSISKWHVILPSSFLPHYCFWSIRCQMLSWHYLLTLLPSILRNTPTYALAQLSHPILEPVALKHREVSTAKNVTLKMTKPCLLLRYAALVTVDQAPVM